MCGDEGGRGRKEVDEKKGGKDGGVVAYRHRRDRRRRIGSPCRRLLDGGRSLGMLASVVEYDVSVLVTNCGAFGEKSRMGWRTRLLTTSMVPAWLS